MSIKNIIQRLRQLFSGAKGSSDSLVGIIKFFDRKKRFGFIIADNHEYFFHAAATNPTDFKALKDGVKVRFSLVDGKKGPQADRIKIIA